MESRRRWLLSGAPSCETTVILQDGLNADGERLDKSFTTRLRWVRPLQRRSAVRHLLRPIPARVRRKEVVTR